MVHKSTWVLLAVESVEIFALNLFFGYFISISPTIMADTARSYFGKLIDVNGVLLGFAGIVFTVTTQRWKKIDKISVMYIIAVASFYLISIVAAFIGLLYTDTIATNGRLVSLLMYAGMWTFIFGSTLLFWGLVIMTLEPKIEADKPRNS